jgi:putative ABC transport system permease protein
MTSLARKTLLHEWRRFLPAVLAIGFACLLQLLQVALVAGIFSSASAQVSGSTADLWAGYPGTRSVNLGRPVSERVRAHLLGDPEVSTVEPFLWVEADWNSPGRIEQVVVSGINTAADGMLYARLIKPETRALLAEPGAVVIDRADTGTLGVKVGDHVIINGHPVHVVATAHGLRSLGAINVVTSLATARRLDPETAPGPTYFVAKLRDPLLAPIVASRLNLSGKSVPFAAWPAPEFASQAEWYWLLDTGAGAGVLFLAVVVFVAGAAISSQTMMAAVTGSLREYATLNALGVSITHLRWVVLEQACWVGAMGLTGAVVLGSGLLMFASAHGIPARLNLPVSLACMVLALAVSAVSGLAAVQGLRRADPALLLR